MKPIRVLQVFSTLDRGGAESMCMNLYRNIDKEKVQFDFVKHTNDIGSFEEEILSLGGKIYTVPRYKIYNHIQYCKSWKNLFNSYPAYKIIHGHYFSISAVYFKIAKKFNVTTVGHSHNTCQKWKGINKLVTEHFRKRVEKYSDYCFACSLQAGKWLFPNKEFIVLKNAIDVESFLFNETLRKKTRKNLNIDNQFVLGHVGRFDAVKNHNFIIDIFNDFLTNNPNSYLVLIGDGKLKLEIEKKVERFNIQSQVIFAGVKSNVNHYLQAMDVMIFPSFTEGLPVSLIEAQAAGLPCLISDSIDNSINVTGLVSFLSIEDGTNNWIDQLKTIDTSNRKIYKAELYESGYDIKSNAIYLSDFYQSIYLKLYKSGEARK